MPRPYFWTLLTMKLFVAAGFLFAIAAVAVALNVLFELPWAFALMAGIIIAPAALLGAGSQSRMASILRHPLRNYWD